jgi:O-antigen/teichoic acid export membrane protein
MPYSLGRPLREWNTRASDIGSGLVGGTAFVLRLPRHLTHRDLLQHASEQLHAERRQFHVELTGWTAAREWNRLLRGNVAGVDALVDPVDGHGSVRLIIPIGSENSVDATVSRQRRGMHVQRADTRSGENAGGDHPWKRRNHNHVGLEPPDLASIDQGNTKARQRMFGPLPYAGELPQDSAARLRSNDGDKPMIPGYAGHCQLRERAAASESDDFERCHGSDSKVFPLLRRVLGLHAAANDTARICVVNAAPRGFLPTTILAQRELSIHELVFDRDTLSCYRLIKRLVMVNRQALNIVANFSGTGARLIFSLAFNVVYFRLLGSEGYGLIGFYASLATLTSFFDLGLNQTTVREVARREADPDRSGELRPVVFTLQLMLGGIGLLLGLLVAACSQWIAASWFSVAQLNTSSVATSVALMGGTLALLFPANFFYGTLMGLQRQVLSNALIIGATVFRGAISIVALNIFGSSPSIFFSAQMIASAIEATFLGGVIWRFLPPSQQAYRFDAGLLRTTWKFTSGTWLAVLFGQFTSVGDKIILSNLLPLDMFGVFSLAVTVTTTIQRLAPPFTNTYFPYFVRLAELNQTSLLWSTYRLATELASAMFLSAGLLLLIYAKPIALLLAVDADSVPKLTALLALLAAANTLNVLTALPLSLQFAQGETWIALRINAVLCVLYLTSLALLVPSFGVDAAAALWLAANAIMFPILIIMTHRVVLKRQAWPWFVRAVLLPGCGAATALAAGAVLMPGLPRLPMLIWIGLNGAVAFAAALLCAPSTRHIILARQPTPDTAGN